MRLSRSDCAVLLARIVLVLLPASAFGGIDVYSTKPVTDNYFDGGYPESAPAGPRQLDVVLTPGEYEPASFVVRTDAELKGLEIRATQLVDSEGAVLAGAEVDIRVVKRWYQRSFGGRSPQEYRYLTSELLVYDDQLIRAEEERNFLRVDGQYIDVSKADKLSEFLTPDPQEFPVRDAATLQPVSLGKDESRQFWVTVFVPAGSGAGSYTAQVEYYLQDDVVATMPLKVEVLPFTLAEPLLEYGIYYRGRLDKARPQGSVSSELKSSAQMLADFKNMRAHGVLNPIIYQRWATGQLADVLDLRRQAGMAGKNLYTLSVSIVPNDEGLITSRLGEQVRDAIKLAAEYDIEQVYFYARDEARGEELLYQVPFWQEVRRNGGKIMAAGWPQTTMFPGNFNTTGGEEDLYVSLGTLSRAEAARWHGKGRRIYSYQNPTGGYELPEAWRRNYGLLLWQYDYDGAFPYAWQHSFGDSWNDFDHYRYRDHNFTYPTVDKPIDTVQWEAFREGVDDVRYLSTLLELLEDKSVQESAYFETARTWLAQLRDTSLAQADLDTVRAQMIGLILGLRGVATEVADAVVVAAPRTLPIDVGGVVEVEWATDQRSNAVVRGSGAVLNSEIPARRLHKVAVEPRQVEAFREFTVEPGGGAGSIDNSPELQLTNAAATRAGNDLVVAADIETNWRSSLGVNTGRSLLGWWRFSGAEDAVKDASDYEHVGELKGSAVRADGRFGQGVRLNGEGSFVNLPDIEIPENGTATIEGWFRFRSFAKDRVKNMALFSGMYQHGDNNHFYFYRTNEHFAVGSYLMKNTWHHIALTWDGDASTARIYIDGQSVPLSIQSEVEEIREIDGLTIGRSIGYFGGLIDSARNTFDGDVDEVRVWNRALSPAEVKASWYSEAGRLQLRVEDAAAESWKIFGVNAAGRELAP